MSSLKRVACIQNNASANVDENIDVCTGLIEQAVAQGASLIATPEYFSGLHQQKEKTIPIAFDYKGHKVIKAFSLLAKKLSVDLLLGSVGVNTVTDKLYNRSVAINHKGEIVQFYDKIHMFDVNLAEGKVFRESATMQAGAAAKIAKLSGLTLGMSICYDLRFAKLYRQLAKAGAQVLTVPAAFTQTTGKAHWHVLNRARAIETGSFVLAPAQFGKTQGGGYNYGHSLIINPWGEVLADAGEEEGFIIADIDLQQVDLCRTKIPSLLHEKPYSLP
jgi:predicted amidohydrolase